MIPERIRDTRRRTGSYATLRIDNSGGRGPRTIRGNVCLAPGACRLSRASSVRSWTWRSSLQVRYYRNRAQAPREDRGEERGMCPEHATEPDETARARAYLIEILLLLGAANQPQCTD